MILVTCKSDVHPSVPANAIGVTWFQAEPCSGGAAFDEARLVLDFPQAAPDDLQQVAGAGEREVGQRPALEDGPEARGRSYLAMRVCRDSMGWAIGIFWLSERAPVNGFTGIAIDDAGRDPSRTGQVKPPARPPSADVSRKLRRLVRQHGLSTCPWRRAAGTDHWGQPGGRRVRAP